MSLPKLVAVTMLLAGCGTGLGAGDSMGGASPQPPSGFGGAYRILPANPEIEVGELARLRLFLATNTRQEVIAALWESSEPSVLAVRWQGGTAEVQGQRVGQARVTATAPDGRSAQTTVTVKPAQ